MKNENRVYLLGRLGKTPEQAFTPNGKAVSKFSLCTDYRYKKGEEWVSVPTWHNLICWGPMSDAAIQLHKGELARIEGSISYHEWTGKDGIKRNTTEILVNKIEAVQDVKKQVGNIPIETDDSEPPY